MLVLRCGIVCTLVERDSEDNTGSLSEGGANSWCTEYTGEGVRGEHGME